MAMLPFCGYNMADYWSHWLKIGQREGANLPSIYYVNWFRKDNDGHFMWPGFGENSRVLKWVFERCLGTAEALETPIGNVPTMDAVDFDDLDLSEEDKAELLRVDVDGWLQEIPLIREYYASFGNRIPEALIRQVDLLEARLKEAQQAVA